SPSFVLPPQRRERQRGVIEPRPVDTDKLVGCDQRIRFARCVLDFVAQKGNQIANHGKSQPQNQWIFCWINKLIDIAGFETGTKIEILRTSADGFSTILGARGKFPLRFVYGNAPAISFLSNGESC